MTNEVHAEGPAAARWTRVRGPGRFAAGALLIAAAVVVAYLPALRGGFIWDDESYVTQNVHLRTWSGLRNIWFDVGATKQYYPAVHTSFWIEYHLWKLDPLGYHVSNVLLHAVGAILLWQVLRRLSVPGAWLAAAVFALHPVQVESVAWVTERKNVLSGVFYFAALLSYIRFSDLSLDRVPEGRPRRYYALSVLLFGCALCSKTVTCSLPAVILLLMWWKRKRLRVGEVLPVVPMFALGLALGLLTAYLEKYSVGALGEEWGFTFRERCLLAGRALWVYLGKLVYPAELAFIYPRWRIDAGSAWQHLYPLAALAVPVSLWLGRARFGKGPLVAALFFGGTLFPALGFIDVFPMQYSFVADHFQYLAGVGPIALFAALLTIALDWPRVRSAGLKSGAGLRTGASAVRAVIPGGLLVVLALLTWNQGHIYRDVETLWRDTLAKNPTAWMAHNNLGSALYDQGQVDQAMHHFRQAVELNPDNAEARNNLARVLAEKGELARAAWHCREVLRRRPGRPTPYFTLGTVLEAQGKTEEAIQSYRQALHLKPDYVRAHNNLATLLANGGDFAEAIEHYHQALKHQPDFADAHNNLGLVLLMQGKLNEAVERFRVALRLRPGFVEALAGLGMTLAEQGKPEEAIEHWRRALRIDPGNVRTWCLLADHLRRLGRTEEAVNAYRRALLIDPNCAAAHHGLRLATGGDAPAGS